ncbi:MAG TPA: hypothetical protein DCL54_09090 [Alphaproteobacteria bacterium]|nr:hypothetical protein [Alphaproteobacteria bacterium]HAJ46719.1 hypothetical protein [Alphaproteobacteria bacterium]
MTLFRTFIRLAPALLAASMMLILASRSSAANPEVFTQGLIDQGVAILADKSGGVKARNERFRDFLLKYADTRTSALFTLGSYRRGASEADLNDFVDAFKDYATAVYEKRLEQYAGQTLKVTGSTKNKDGDFTVNAVEAGNNPQPLKVAFRLMGQEGNYRFVDVNVAGVWLSIEQRDQFASFLGANGGKIPALSANLRQQASNIRAGG